MSIASPKQSVKRRKKDAAFLQIMIHRETIAIFWDSLSHMGEATIYRAAAEGQYRFKNYYGRGVYALVTGLRSTCVSAMHQFTPLYSIYFL